MSRGWQGNCRNGETSNTRYAAGSKTLESAVTTEESPPWLCQSLGRLKVMAEKEEE